MGLVKVFKKRLIRRRKQFKEKRLGNHEEYRRLKRGEKKWYLGDTDAFVWARDEANAQRKWKAKLLRDAKKAEKEKM